MKRFLFLGLLFVLLIVATVKVAAIFSSTELDPNNWMAEVAIKHKRLDSLKGERAVFIGDSSLVFGLDAKSLEEKLSKPTANMGIHGALGLPFYFQEVKGSLRDGDNVFAIFYYYPSKDDVNEGVLCHALDFYPSLKTRLEMNWLEKVRFSASCDLKRTRRYLLNKARGQKINTPIPTKSTVFESAMSAFNQYGDIYDELHQEHLINFAEGSGFLPHPPQAETFKLISSSKELYEKVGAKLYIIYPPYPKSLFKKNQKLIEDYDKELRQNTNVEVLNHPIDSVLDDNLFFNSQYHLNTEGKKQFTNYLAGLVKPLTN